MTRANASVEFEVVDECHRQIHTQLASLESLAQMIAEDAANPAAAAMAATIEAFFSGTARQHHADEEQTVFPPLLASDDAALVAAVRILQQDHSWMEDNWLALAPKLRAIAEGCHCADPTEFLHAVQVFVELCAGHIALEESVVYPEAKGRRADALAQREANEKAGNDDALPGPFC